MKTDESLQATGIKPSVAPTDAESKAQQLAERRRKNEAIIALLRSWANGDEQEQHETWEYLKAAVDEDRLSDRKFYP